MKICMILPSLSSGGMERVMTQLAWQFSKKPSIELMMVLMTKGEHFYELPKSVELTEPDFDHRRYSRPVFTFKIYRFLRSVLQENRPDVLLSFGGKYNAFVLLAARGLTCKSFVSDRSRPGISYGKLQDMINPVVYRMAHGIVAQTKQAYLVLKRQTAHKNIRIIGNPIRDVGSETGHKERIILNVGRFISTKHQDWLVRYFDEVCPATWRLVFLGDGEYMESVKELAATLPSKDRIEFKGTVADIDEWYKRAAIFAFTSTSEGFPNALGEAMTASCACIAFDCNAGPSDLIENGVNGFLIKEKDHVSFQSHLKILCNREDLRERFGREAKETMNRYKVDAISEQFYDFLTSE